MLLPAAGRGQGRRGVSRFSCHSQAPLSRSLEPSVISMRPDHGRAQETETAMTFGKSRPGTKIAALLALVAVAAPVAALGATDGSSAQTGGGERGSPASAPPQLPKGGERVDLKPADFTTRIDNPYWPMKPGSHWIYRETDTEGTKQRV